MCFDPGNRLFVRAATDGFGGGIRLRHVVRFDDEPDLVWKLEHRFLEASVGGLTDDYTGVFYAGQFLRHARDGHIVLPLGTPKKIFLPFDIGADAQVGRATGTLDSTALSIGVVRTALLLDLSRSESFARRLAVGVVAQWDVDLEREPEIEITEHVVKPLSSAVVDAHAESDNGLTLADLRVEAGLEWSSIVGWRTEVLAEASVERILVAINDRPLSMFAGARYSLHEHELRGAIGVRLTLVGRRHARVQTDR